MIYYNYASGANTPLPGVGRNKLGHSLGTTTNYNNLYQPVTLTTVYHYAVRIRFGIYLINNQKANYYYPLRYSMDGVSYSYDQTTLNYYSC